MPAARPWYRSPNAIVVAGCLIAIITFGVRTSFGLFTDPLTEARGFDRERSRSRSRFRTSSGASASRSPARSPTAGAPAAFSRWAGSFLGALMGGTIYASTGSYDTMWVLCILLSVFAAIVHLPIREQRATVAVVPGTA